MNAKPLVSQVPQTVVAGTLGLTWSAARALLQNIGIPIVPDGPRRWHVAAADWQRLKANLLGVRGVA